MASLSLVASLPLGATLPTTTPFGKASTTNELLYMAERNVFKLLGSIVTRYRPMLGICAATVPPLLVMSWVMTLEEASELANTITCPGKADIVNVVPSFFAYVMSAGSG